MHRRRVLSITGSAFVGTLAGCLGGSAPGFLDGRATGVQRIVNISDQDGPISDVVIEVDLLVAEVTPNRTANFRVSVTNDGPERAIQLRDDYFFNLFAGFDGGSDPDGLWLKYEEDHDWYSSRDDDGGKVDELWRRGTNPDESRNYPLGGLGSKTFAEGESIEMDYLLWDDYRTKSYMEQGVYRFEGSFALPEDRDEFEWGFQITVEMRE